MLLNVEFFCAIPGLSGVWAPDPPGASADRGWSRQPSPEGVQTDADVDPPDPDTGRSAEVPPVSNRRTTVGSLFSSYMMASLGTSGIMAVHIVDALWLPCKGYLYIKKNFSKNFWLTIYILVNGFVLHLLVFHLSGEQKMAFKINLPFYIKKKNRWIEKQSFYVKVIFLIGDIMIAQKVVWMGIRKQWTANNKLLFNCFDRFIH